MCVCVCARTYPVACVLRWGKVLSMEEGVTLKYDNSIIMFGTEKEIKYNLIYNLIWTDYFGLWVKQIAIF